jgi:ubiquinone/menaquinone biosynthesis C-methylase UbiE
MSTPPHCVILAAKNEASTRGVVSVEQSKRVKVEQGGVISLAMSPCNADEASEVPQYLEETYRWAYLSRLGRFLLDRSLVVSAILWGNAQRLIGSVVEELAADQRVLQSACVYGDFSKQLATAVGSEGQLDVIDVAPIQVKYCRRKLRAYPQARVCLADAATWKGDPYDTVCCFFLLHEVPESYKHKIVDNLLNAVPVGGKVVFVDYHRPRKSHPLTPVMRGVFRWLEPYAHSLWEREIENYAKRRLSFTWSKRTYFGGLYQKVVAVREP